jgi:hypothetical protein
MLAEVQARIESQVTAFNLVDDAATFAAVGDRKPARDPAAYIIPIGEQARPNGTVNLVRQELTERFGVVIATSNRREQHGGAAARDIEALKVATLAALLGWHPTADHDGVEYASGRAVAFKDGFVWWLCEFTTRQTISST